MKSHNTTPSNLWIILYFQALTGNALFVHFEEEGNAQNFEILSNKIKIAYSNCPLTDNEEAERGKSNICDILSVFQLV